jgi:hypothetical protein
MEERIPLLERIPMLERTPLLKQSDNALTASWTKALPCARGGVDTEIAQSSRATHVAVEVGIDIRIIYSVCDVGFN